MPKRAKTGGRVKGTPNRMTKDVMEMLQSLGCNPIEGMARIAMDPNNTPELRGKMCAELAQYVYPKRKSLEGVPGGEPIQHKVKIEFVEGPNE